MPGRLFVITGPSGVGKTTIAHRLLETHENLTRLVTYTTRPPRGNEQDGVDYHFVTTDAFEALIAAGEMFEWARVYDNYYGNREADLDAVLAAGKNVLMVVDVQGAKTIQAKRSDAFVIFLQPDSPDVLRARLERRGDKDETDIARRQEALTAELAFAAECNAQVVNQDGKLEETVRAVEKEMQLS